jgi:cobaltochelatase CobS
MLTAHPDLTLSVRQVFGLDTDMTVPGYSERHPHVPEVDAAYRFDPATTIAILTGFAHNRRVLVQGYHGTGKSSHIEQVAARLNWPCIRINLDSHISRTDLVGRDALVVRDGEQVTEFQPGLLPQSLASATALVFDEYDAGRPEVMFVIQRLLESQGKLTLLDQNRILTPHPQFRLFATANTIGLGDATGLYHGTHPINQAQMDRWHMVVQLNYLPPAREQDIVLAKCPAYDTAAGRATVAQMVALAGLTREAFINQDLTVPMSPRTVITWAENAALLAGDLAHAFRLSFYNKCDEAERPILEEFYQRCFNQELTATKLV